MEKNKCLENNISNSNIYIEDDDYTKETINESSLLGLSWIGSVEEELSSSIENKEFLISNKPENKSLDLNTILTGSYIDSSDSIILEYQTYISSHLRKLLKSSTAEDFNIDDFTTKINWLVETSKILGERVGLIMFKHKTVDITTIPRSSYKFCNYNFECEFNYNVKKHYGCFAQHYVHNLVNADVDALKLFILNNKANFSSKIFDEIKKSVNTISYVISHMYEELKNAQKFNFFNINNSHIERTPYKKRKKLDKKEKEQLVLSKC
jgi:hypothetical protein